VIEIKLRGDFVMSVKINEPRIAIVTGASSGIGLGITGPSWSVITVSSVIHAR